MCNLYRLETSVDAIRNLFGGFEGDRGNMPLYEGVYPNREAPILRNVDNKLILQTMTWGVPPPASGGRPVTNVRNLTSPFWRSMLNSLAQRCLVPATAFCEWTGDKGSKRKVWFALKDAPIFSFAGIWRDTDDGARMVFLTCEANDLVKPVHPKAMPVILNPAEYSNWLDGDYTAATALAKPYPANAMEILE